MNILITGSSRGLGEALAMEYLKKGNSVFGISRSKSDILIKNSNYKHLHLDLNSEINIKEDVGHFLKETETIDLVILNAGILPSVDDMEHTSLDEIKKVMQVNVWSNKLLIDALSKNRKEIKQIVAISSGAAVSGARGWNAYAISKAALNMMISLYSKEKPETHFTSLAPGVIETGMQDYLCGLPKEKDFPVIKRLKEMRANGEMMTADEAAENLIRVIPSLLRFESGRFMDVREL
jgi:NAD(P)-dependent dehydrogenase (short-subunit alcohol dehydrogenase family)